MPTPTSMQAQPNFCGTTRREIGNGSPRGHRPRRCQSPARPPPVKGPLRRYAPLTGSSRGLLPAAMGTPPQSGPGPLNELCCYIKSRGAPDGARPAVTCEGSGIGTSVRCVRQWMPRPRACRSEPRCGAQRGIPAPWTARRHGVHYQRPRWHHGPDQWQAACSRREREAPCPLQHRSSDGAWPCCSSPSS